MHIDVKALENAVPTVECVAGEAPTASLTRRIGPFTSDGGRQKKRGFAQVRLGLG